MGSFAWRYQHEESKLWISAVKPGRHVVSIIWRVKYVIWLGHNTSVKRYYKRHIQFPVISYDITKMIEDYLKPNPPTHQPLSWPHFFINLIVTITLFGDNTTNCIYYRQLHSFLLFSALRYHKSVTNKDNVLCTSYRDLLYIFCLTALQVNGNI